MNIHAVLHEATIALKASNNSDEEKLEAQLLLEHVLTVNHAWLITHADDEINSEAHQQFKALIQRRISGEPIAHILGGREFYGLALKITPDTLIPRPDTETLVEAVLAKISPSETTRILDLGTGSGAIALVIATLRPNANVIAVDASQAALSVAQENVKALNIHNVQFLLSDWFSTLTNQHFDVIVSNPPYIEQDDDHLKQGDLRFEPISALASGEDGLDDIRQIILEVSAHLKPKGWVMFEHGYNQAKSVSVLLASAHFISIETLKDLGSNDRVTFGQKP
ncbi:MAG: release factor glutamine methyltransferase [Methylophilaceae bacterium]|jgi:release factor glutamine methyltransferase